MKLRFAWLPALLSFAPCVRASPAWPVPPRSTTGPASTAQDIDQNLTLIKGNNAPEARKLGAVKLLEAGNTEATSRLSGILQNKTPDLAAQIAVCAAIADFENPSPSLLDSLLTLLGDARPGLSDVLTAALHRFDSPLLVERLRPIALDPSSARLRRLAAITALGTTVDDKNAVATLAALLDDQSRSVRDAALAAFAQATGIAHPDPAAAREWWQAHDEMSPVDWLRAVNQARTSQVRAMTAERSELTKRLIASYREAYLHTAEAGRSRFLQSLLADTLPSVRLLGLDLINDLITDRKEINPELRPIIVDTLADPDPKVRTMAARMVSDLRLTVAMAKLTDALARESDDDVRAAQVAALGRLDDIEAVPTLIERLNDESPLVVGESAVALGSLARRGREDSQLTASVTKVLLDRYQATSPAEAELCEKLLLAMTAVGAPEFLSIFKREISPDRTASVRRIAIGGLAAMNDPAVAATVRPLLASKEPEIRLAVMDALGKCGRSKDDLDVLNGHLGVEREPDAGVRQRAWDSYLLIVQRLTPEQRLSIADSFDLPDDKTAQRRRLDILKALKADATVYDALSPERKVDQLEQMADAQVKIAEFVGAAASLEQATGLLKDPSSPRYSDLSARCVAALLRGREDERALERIGELTDGESVNGELLDSRALSDVLRDEIRSRIGSGESVTDLNGALKLIALSGPFTRKTGPSFEREIDALRSEAISRRDAAIDGVLATLPNDPEAESKLIQDDNNAVLSRVYRRLSAPPASSTPTMDSDDRLIKLARRLAPQWNGYALDASPEQKAESLSRLRELCEAPKEDHSAVPVPESATSAPVEKTPNPQTASSTSEP